MWGVKMNPTAVLILVLILILVGAYFASRYRFTKATRQIMQLFNSANAFDPQNAVKAEVVGVANRPFYMRMGMRDYKMMAFQGMVQANIILTLETEEGNKYYLSRKHYDSFVAKN